MPGIVGLITGLPKEVCEEWINKMVETMRYEPSYSYGQYISPEMYMYMGWTCHKSSFADCLPVFNEQRNIILFITGEVFLDSDLAIKLRSNGHVFSEGDASYLIHLYEEMGDNFYETLNGCFFGAIIDQRIGKAFLFNDRFGMQRIFIHQNQDGFYFSSEAKALLKVLPETREFDRQGMCEFLTCGCTLEDHSLFKSIEILPGGSLLEFENGRLRRRTCYFDRKAWGGQEHLNKEEFVSHITDIIPRIVQKYLSSKTPVAISLTGGIDSRMVIACIADNQVELPCYTFASMYRDTSDVKISRRVAAACGQKHQTLLLGPEFLLDFQAYLGKAVYIADGYIGLGGAAELFLNKLARQIAPVRLTGNYGGELLRGVRAFKSLMPRNSFVNPDIFTYLKEAQERFNEIAERTDPVSFAAFVQAPNQGFGRRAVEQSQVILRTPYLDNDLIGLLYQFPVSKFIGREVAAEVIARYRPALLKISTDRGWIQNDTSASKMLYHLYQKIYYKAEYWTNHGMPHWVARFLNFFPYLNPESLFLGRHKFHHFRLWLRNPLESYIREVIFNDMDSSLNEYFDQKKVRKMFEEHQNGVKNWTEEIDNLVAIQLVRKHLFRGVMDTWKNKA